jgi:hypothetical protein
MSCTAPTSQLPTTLLTFSPPPARLDEFLFSVSIASITVNFLATLAAHVEVASELLWPLVVPAAHALLRTSFGQNLGKFVDADIKVNQQCPVCS